MGLVRWRRGDWDGDTAWSRGALGAPQEGAASAQKCAPTAAGSPNPTGGAAPEAAHVRAHEIEPCHPCTCLRECTAAGLHPGTFVSPSCNGGTSVHRLVPPPLHNSTATCSRHRTLSVAHSQRCTPELSELEPAPHPPNPLHPPTAGRCGSVGAVRWGRCGASRGRAISAAAPGAPPPRAARGRPAPPHAAMVSAYPPPPLRSALPFISANYSLLPPFPPTFRASRWTGSTRGCGGVPGLAGTGELGGGWGGPGRAVPRWRRNGGGLAPRAR